MSRGNSENLFEASYKGTGVVEATAFGRNLLRSAVTQQLDRFCKSVASRIIFKGGHKGRSSDSELPGKLFRNYFSP